MLLGTCPLSCANTGDVWTFWWRDSVARESDSHLKIGSLVVLVLRFGGDGVTEVRA